MWPRSQGEKALVALWPLGPQAAAARSSNQQNSLRENTQGHKGSAATPSNASLFLKLKFS